MTHLQDARLRKALDFAPDGTQAPTKSVGDAIKNEAFRALQQPLLQPTDGRWARLKAWWLPPGHMPWNAAFASLLLASLVTLVWRGEDTPGAEPEALPGLPAPASPESPKAQVRPQADLAQPTPREALHDRPVAPAVRARTPSPAAAPVADTVPVPPTPPSALPSTPPLPSTLPPLVAAPGVVAPLPAEAPATSTQPPALRAAPARKAAQDFVRAESAAARVGANAVAAADAWTLVRVTSAGLVRELPRPSSPDWVAVVDRLLAVAVTPAPLVGEPALQLDLLQGNTLLGRLTLAGSLVRWAPVSEAGRSGQVDAALLRELQSLLPREPAIPSGSAP